MALSTRKLNKGHIRKLTALRKSLGPKIADEAFTKWQASQKTTDDPASDNNAEAIAKLLSKPILSGKIKLPKGGYIVKRGRGRVLVAEAKPVVRRRRKTVAKKPAAKKAPAKKSAAK